MKSFVHISFLALILVLSGVALVIKVNSVGDSIAETPHKSSQEKAIEIKLKQAVSLAQYFSDTDIAILSANDIEAYRTNVLNQSQNDNERALEQTDEFTVFWVSATGLQLLLNKALRLQGDNLTFSGIHILAHGLRRRASPLISFKVWRLGSWVEPVSSSQQELYSIIMTTRLLRNLAVKPADLSGSYMSHGEATARQVARHKAGVNDSERFDLSWIFERANEPLPKNLIYQPQQIDWTYSLMPHKVLKSADTLTQIIALCAYLLLAALAAWIVLRNRRVI